MGSNFFSNRYLENRHGYFENLMCNSWPCHAERRSGAGVRNRFEFVPPVSVIRADPGYTCAHTLPTWLSDAGLRASNYMLESLPKKSKNCVISVNEWYIEFWDNDWKSFNRMSLQLILTPKVWLIFIPVDE